MDYYERIKDLFEKKYWSTPPRNIYIPNGYSHIKPLKQKASYIRPLITRSGRIIDMGCGNGLLLKLLVSNSIHKLTPHGVDILEQSIEQAKNIIFPTHKKNFSAGNINDHVFKKKFDYILISPVFVADEDFKTYFKKCYSSLALKGVLIVYVDPDVLPLFRKRKKTISFLKSQSLHWTASPVLLGHIQKTKIKTPVQAEPAFLF